MLKCFYHSIVFSLEYLVIIFSSRSVLVLNGNGADVAKHCVPAVPAKRYRSKLYIQCYSCLLVNACTDGFCFLLMYPLL